MIHHSEGIGHFFRFSYEQSQDSHHCIIVAIALSLLIGARHFLHYMEIRKLSTVQIVTLLFMGKLLSIILLQCIDNHKMDYITKQLDFKKW